MRKIQVANESAPLGERLAVASPGPTAVANGGHGYAASISLASAVSIGAAALGFIIIALIVRSLRKARRLAYPNLELDSNPMGGALPSQQGQGQEQEHEHQSPKPLSVQVPVVIVEPDASVEVGWALRANSAGQELPMTTDLNRRSVPILRSPTLPAALPSDFDNG